ncbi:MAG: hypothetical protein ACE10O_04905, partial [Candidatus Acidiferrales bacterium]
MLRLLSGRAAYFAIGLCLFLAGVQLTQAQEAEALSPRNANYTIQVRLDPAEKTLQGTEVLTWRNDARFPATEL